MMGAGLSFLDVSSDAVAGDGGEKWDGLPAMEGEGAARDACYRNHMFSCVVFHPL
jgi:hypothetical protein